MSARSFGAAAAAAPSTIVLVVFPPVVRLTIWHPVTP